MKKKLLAMMLTTAMVLSLTACGGNGGGDTAAGGNAESGSANKDGVSITIFNSKIEVQEQFEEMAKEYSAAKGVNVEVYYSNDTVAAHMATRYSANDPYTLSMVDAKDIYSLAGEHAADLTGEAWVDKTDYAISVDGKVVGFPVCIEARGLMYNADAIEAVTGKTFNPDEYKTLDAFQGLLEELVAGGMETPTGVMKEDWSLGGHFLAEIYEEQPDVNGYVSSLYAGTADLANNAKWNSMMDTFDTLLKYNYAAKSPIAAEREVSEQKLAEGEIAFMFGGNWDWSMINAYDYSENMGMMPLPQNTDDGSNEKLVGGDMRSGDNLVHAFGDVSVSGKANTFDVTFSDLPYNVCVTLANLNWIIQDSSDLVSLDINGTKYNWPEAAKDAAHQLPMDINRAMTSCTRDKESAITWEFQ